MGEKIRGTFRRLDCSARNRSIIINLRIGCQFDVPQGTSRPSGSDLEHGQPLITSSCRYGYTSHVLYQFELKYSVIVSLSADLLRLRSHLRCFWSSIRTGQETIGSYQRANWPLPSK